jgi:vacuole morphology and inheritance protein 14
MLVLLLQKSPSDSEIRSESILKKFCNILEADKFCKTICYRITQKLEDKKFIFEIVQNLNNLIITEKNMLRMRKKLQNKDELEHKEFFMILFNAFRYNPAAVTSLCFMSQEYELAYRILNSFGVEFEISHNILIGFCKLASMIESPGFLCNFVYIIVLRLQIL